MTVVGIDACRKGWAAVVLRDEDPKLEVHFLPTIEGVANAALDAQVVAIDIPIGLPISHFRAADIAARSFVGARRNSVFMTPVRAAMEAPTYREAIAISIELTGAGISQQAYALRTKILEVDRWLPNVPCPLFEVHPEVSFTVMLGAPPTASKKTWHGMSERLRALRQVGIRLDNVDSVAGSIIGTDDIIDAAAAAWSARRLASGTARSFADSHERGEASRAVAIWA